MKKPLAIALYFVGLMPAMLGASQTLYAQEAAQDTPSIAASTADASGPDKVVEMLATKLSLTSDQKTQIAPIIANRQEKLKALRDDTSMRRMQRARAAKKIFADSDKKINTILTPDQQRTYAALEQQMRDQMRERMQQTQNTN